jgi:hypothetical protein
VLIFICPDCFVDVLSGVPEVQDDSGPVRAATPFEILEDACESDYGIPASPMGSGVPFGDANQVSGSSAMTSYITKLLETAFTVDYDQYGIPGSPTGSLVSIDDATEATSECAVPSSPSLIPIDHSSCRFVASIVPA